MKRTVVLSVKNTLNKTSTLKQPISTELGLYESIIINNEKKEVVNDKNKSSVLEIDQKIK